MDEHLSALLTSLRERFDPRIDGDEEVRAYLVAEGYDERRIGEVLALFRGDRGGSTAPVGASMGARRRGVPVHQSVAFRVLGPHERGRFAPEAWGHLLSLAGGGMLTGAELEHVIERALTHIEGRIGLDDLRALLDVTGESDARPSAGGSTIH